MRIIIVDDDSFVCASLKTILEAEGGILVDAVGGDGEAAERLYETYKPDILLLDIQMKNKNGLDAAEAILGKYPEVRILFLTTFSDDAYIVKALRIGAKGYLIKQDISAIAPALRAVMSGQSVFGSEVVLRLPELMKGEQRRNLAEYGIGEKEQEIIRLVAEGLSNREIADQMYLGEGTIRNYLSTILDKLGLRDRTQLAIFYHMGNSLHFLDKNAP